MTNILQGFIVIHVDNESTQNIVERRYILMVNTQGLANKIDSSGLKRSYIADELGITVQNLALKINNKSDFRLEEVKALCKILDIRTKSEIQDIFLL